MTTPSPVGGKQTRQPLTLEAKQRIIDAYEAGVSIKGIAATFGHARTTVRKVLREACVPLRNDAAKPKISREELTQRHADGWTPRMIADHSGADIRTIHQRLAELGLPVAPRIPDLPVSDIVVEHGEGKSLAALARKYGVAEETIARRMAAVGRAPAKGEPIISPLKLADLCRRGLTATEMSRATGIGKKTLRKHLAAAGLRAADKRPGRERPAFLPADLIGAGR